VVHPRVELVETLERIYSYKMTTTSGGNLSVRDDLGDVWVTPARVDKGSLRATDIVRVRPDGTSEGLHPASSELPFHRAIYRARPDLRAVIHAHPVALVAFSICGRVPETRVIPQARHVCGRVGFAPYELPGSEALGRSVAQAFEAGYDCVVLENHGVVCGGATLAQAFQRFETLEFTAKTIVKGSMLGKVRELSDEQIELAERGTMSLDERAPVEAGKRAVFTPFEPGPAGTLEREARDAVASFVRRGYRQRLFTSTEGSFSARIDPRGHGGGGLSGDAFVMTQYQADRKTVTPDELVLIDGQRHEAGKSPSRAAYVHQAIYRRHPEITAIVNAQPVNTTAFAATGTRLDTRTIPESYVFLLDVPVAPFDYPYRHPAKLAELVGPTQPVVMLEHNGAIVAGRTALDAFDRLEVLEATCEAVINAKPLGPVRVMEGEKIAELRRAFLGEK
jgi:L-fuculose-phosphate aldolase